MILTYYFKVFWALPFLSSVRGAEMMTSRVEFIHTKAWNQLVTDKHDLKAHSANILSKREFHCHLAQLQKSTTGYYLTFKENSVCESGVLPDEKVIYKAHSEHGLKLFRNVKDPPINYTKHVLMVNGYFAIDLNLLEDDDSLIKISFPKLPSNQLSAAYLPRDPSVFFCNPIHGGIEPEDRCWKLKIGATEYEEIAPLQQPLLIGHFTTVFHKTLWIAGGKTDIDKTTTIDTSQTYDEFNNIWQDGPSLPLAVGGGCLKPVDKEQRKFMLLGGQTRTLTSSDQVFLFDWGNPAGGWSGLKKMPGPRYRPGCDIFEWKDGTTRMGVVGGSLDVSPTNAQNTFFQYVFETNTWISSTAPNNNILRTSVLGNGRKLWSLGGFTTVANEFDAETEQWTEMDSTWNTPAFAPCAIWFNY